MNACFLVAVFLLFGIGLPAFAETITFDDVASAVQLDFRHTSPISPERHLHLFMGSGVAWTDFDRDGVLDLLFCQGIANPRDYSSTVPALELCRGQTREITFPNVSRAAGLSGAAHAMGLTVADYDNDGFADIFVTGLFSAALYRNNGDGTLSNVTTPAGIVASGFGTGCSWCDLDADGNLDLLYVRYAKIDPDRYPLCTVPYQGRDFAISCNPKRLTGDRDSVYRNAGDGRFEDITVSSGFSTVPPRHGLGSVALDLDDDQNVEIYVANDGMPNDLWKNLGGNQFEERGLLAGVALNRHGAAEAGMGVAAGDIDGDLRPDLFVTNYFDETNTLYRNEGGLLFLDVTEDFGIAAPSRKKLGFGVTLSDFDNDGWPDLFVANGHVQDQLHLIGITDQPFAQLPQVFANLGGRRFEDVSAKGGLFFQRPWVARGSAAADFDDDGKVDVVVLRLNDRAALLHNKTKDTGHWLTLELSGTISNRDAIGAVVIVRSGKSAWRRDRMSSASYLSCDSPRLHFGIGHLSKNVAIEVRWPSGRSEVFLDVPVDRLSRLIEGTGQEDEG